MEFGRTVVRMEGGDGVRQKESQKRGLGFNEGLMNGIHSLRSRQ